MAIPSPEPATKVNWSVQVTDKNFIPQGEITNIHELKVEIPLNKVNNATFKIRLDNPLAPFIAQECSIQPLFIKCYRNSQLLFFGNLATMQEVGEENQKATLQVNAVGPEFIFANRLTGLTAEGIKFAEGTELAKRFTELLEKNGGEVTHEGVFLGQTHLNIGTIQSTNKKPYESTYFRTLADILNEMALQAEGFDFECYPTEPSSLNFFSGTIGKFEIKDAIKTERPNALFEWGTGRENLSGFTRTVDCSKLLNRAWNVSSAGPEATGAPTLKAEDLESQEKWGVWEENVPVSALNIAARESIIKEDVLIRKKPRQTLSFTPVNEDGAKRLPLYGQEYSTGDIVPVNIVYQKVPHFSGNVRVWAVTFSLDEKGTETQTLTISDT